jgi:enoyl-CoA hydratase/carnithine racemase
MRPVEPAMDGAGWSSAVTPVREHNTGGVLVLTLAHPDRRNALSEAMLAALTAAIDRASVARDVRVVVIAGEGPAFCAGHDLKELTARRADPDRGAAYFADIMGRCAAMMQAIISCPKPVIAAVEGVASAAGCQLVATCDLAVASTAARFVTPGVNIGLFCSTPMVALTRNLSRKDAMEMLLLGEMVEAERARQIGLVNRVVPAGEALQSALAMASVIASKSPLTVGIGKSAFYRQLEMPLVDAYAETAAIMVENMLARDAEEGIGAFIEKRPPIWHGE